MTTPPDFAQLPQWWTLQQVAAWLAGLVLAGRPPITEEQAMPLVKAAWQKGDLVLFGSKSLTALPEEIPPPHPRWEAVFAKTGELYVSGAFEVRPAKGDAPANFVRKHVATWRNIFARSADCIRLWGVPLPILAASVLPAVQSPLPVPLSVPAADQKPTAMEALGPAQPAQAQPAQALPRLDRKADQRAILAALEELYGEKLATGRGSQGPVSIGKMQRRLSKDKRLDRTTDSIKRALGRKT